MKRGRSQENAEGIATPALDAAAEAPEQQRGPKEETKEEKKEKEAPRQSAKAEAAAAAMPTEFRAKLGDGAFDVPDEAKDIEEITAGYADYEDLPEARRTNLARAVTQMVQRIEERGARCTLKDAEAVYNRYHRMKAAGGVARKSELTAAYRRLVRAGAVNTCPMLEDVLIKKRGKSHSGVLVVTVLMGPGQFSCPKDCHYCPNQPGIARSYLLREPGVLRGFRNEWDPVRQFYDRASALENNGHVVDKIELLILGGTFSFYPKDYADEFIGGLFYAANTYYDAPPLRPVLPLQEEIALNETGRCRIIGLTVETRPDYITTTELRRFRQLGVTRVQVGIQHLDDNVLDTVNRECPTSKTIVALRRLLDGGFKVDAHWMPDLPGSSFAKDMEMFEHLLSPENVAFQVDQWKVYPTMTVPFTKIREWHEQGLYKPYAELEDGALMVRLLMFIMRTCPHRIRLNRIVRDIPTSYIVGGEARVNLRQVLEQEMRRQGVTCHDIRERECKGQPINKSESAVFIDEFPASGGTEFYMSIENTDRTVLFGHLRLRLPSPQDDGPGSDPLLFPALQGAALIRELHTYGKLVAVDAVNTGAEAQHVGVGTQLMAMAERTALERGYHKAAVIAGIGVRAYYAKLGYTLQDTYMVKTLATTSLLARFKAAVLGI